MQCLVRRHRPQHHRSPRCERLGGSPSQRLHDVPCRSDCLRCHLRCRADRWRIERLGTAQRSASRWHCRPGPIQGRRQPRICDRLLARRRLTRRSPSVVDNRPHPSTQPGKTSFRFHRRPNCVHSCPPSSMCVDTERIRVHGSPHPSIRIGSEWPPTWLPLRESTSRCVPTIRLVSSGIDVVCRETEGGGNHDLPRMFRQTPGWPTRELR